jgi:hypothetical protein
LPPWRKLYLIPSETHLCPQSDNSILLDDKNNDLLFILRREPSQEPTRERSYRGGYQETIGQRRGDRRLRVLYPRGIERSDIATL